MANIALVHARLSAAARPQRYHIVESFADYFPRYRPLLQGYTEKEREAIHLASWSAMQTTLPFDVEDTQSGELLFRAETYFLRHIPEQFLCLYAFYWRKCRRAEHSRKTAECFSCNSILGLLSHESSPSSYLLKRIDAATRYHDSMAKEQVEESSIQFHLTVASTLREAAEFICIQENIS